MSARESCEAIFAIILIGTLFVWAAHNGGRGAGQRETEKQAVEAKVAEYYLDQNNDRQFRFKAINQETK